MPLCPSKSSWLVARLAAYDVAGDRRRNRLGSREDRDCCQPGDDGVSNYLNVGVTAELAGPAGLLAVAKAGRMRPVECPGNEGLAVIGAPAFLDVLEVALIRLAQRRTITFRRGRRLGIPTG